MQNVRVNISVHCRGTTGNPIIFDTKRIPNTMNIDRMKWNWPTLAESNTINNRLFENPRIEIPITRRIGPDVGRLTLVIMKHQPTQPICQKPTDEQAGTI